MRAAKRLTLAAPPPDPFGERRRPAWCEHLQLLGGRFDFETDSAQLRRIVRLAYAGLPPHRLAGSAPHFRIRLQLTPRTSRRRTSRGANEPPPVRPLAGAGLLCGAIDGAGFVTLATQQRAALLAVPQDLLRHAYHVRYELLEFAVYVLAARVQKLLPLHAACVGRGGEGLLLIGPSGSGKSTLVLHSLLAGLDFLAEDSVLVEPTQMRATGIANFLHLRPDALRFLDRAGRAAVLRGAAVIRRRSGVEKLEIEMRRREFQLAAMPQRIRAVVFLSRRLSGSPALLKPLPKAVVLGRLRATQRYAATQPGWRLFIKRLSALPGYELRRGSHPREAVAVLERLLAPRPASSAARRR